jgi:endonuclease/exonuclease/phosphatase family metal-dependent hydrolase
LSANTLVDGVEVRVFNTHLAEGPQAKERSSQVAELAGEVRQHGRAVVLGDFNAEPRNRELSGMWSAGLKDADPGLRPTAAGHHKKFDYVWLNHAFSARLPGVGITDIWSDHDYVYSDVNNTL